MKLRQKQYLLAAVLFILPGVFLVCKSSIGKYLDPWVSRESKYKGNMSYWVVVAGIALILLGIIMMTMAFVKDTKQVKVD